VGARDYAGAAARGHRQGEAAGKYKGRPVSIDAAQIRQLRVEFGPVAIAKKLGIARSSVYRALGAA
jgi:DNA invertase Pin-like site-specific DNA recombinase